MRTVIIYSVILSTSLAGAWYRWTAEPDPTSGTEVVVLQGAGDDIEVIHWETEEEKSILTLKADEHGTYIWVEYTDNRPQTAEEEPEPIVKDFKAGTKAETLIEKLSPLIGLRKFQSVSDEQIENFGLNTPTATLTITRRGREQVLTVGGETYGTNDLYLRVEDTKEVFLVDDATLKSLKFARNQLIDRSLWSVENKKLVKMTIIATEEDLVIDHNNWQDPESAQWRFQDMPEADNAQLTTWIEKFLRIKGNRYADADFDVAALKAQFTIRMEDASQRIENIAFSQDEENNWWASSEHTRGHLKVISQSIEPLYSDLEGLSQLEPEEPITPLQPE